MSGGGGCGGALTVTADDLGLSRHVDEAVRRCLEAGSVHRLSVLAAGPTAGAAMELASSCDAAVSVHLDCIEGPFLTGASFPGSTASWALSARRLASEVRREWSAQIERVLSRGLMVTGLDSHRHVHHLAPLREVVLDLAEEYGAGTVRAARLPDRAARVSGRLLDRLGARLAAEAAARGLGTPSCMLGFSASGSVSRAYIERYYEGGPGEGSVELVMHPSVEPVWSGGQPGELALMLSPWFVRLAAGR